MSHKRASRSSTSKPSTTSIKVDLISSSSDEDEEMSSRTTTPQRKSRSSTGAAQSQSQTTAVESAKKIAENIRLAKLVKSNVPLLSAKSTRRPSVAAKKAPVTKKRKRPESSNSDDESEEKEESESEEESEPEKKKTKRKSTTSSTSKRKKRKESESESESETDESSSSSSSEDEQPVRRGRGRPSISSTLAAAASAAKKKKITILDAEVPLSAKDDVCMMCHDGGRLFVCDKCVHAFHQHCLEQASQDNYEFFKELGDDDPITCVSVGQRCTERTKVLTVEDTIPQLTQQQLNDKVKWGQRERVVGGKKFYKSFTRHGDTHTVGSFITLKNDDPENGPRSKNGTPLDYVAQIESMYEEVATGSKMVECRWLFLPEETRTGRLREHEADEIFMTTHMDDNEIDAIQDLCEVVDYDEYRLRKSEGSAHPDTESTRRIFFVRQTYDHDRGEFRPWIAPTMDVKLNTKKAVTSNSLTQLNGRRAGGTSGENGKTQSIYSKACAQLQLSAAPPRLPCREKEHKQIYSFIESSLKRGHADGGLYIAGVPGTGKTATVVRVIRELFAREDLPNFEFIEVNGMKLPEPNQLYTKLWKDLTGKHATPAKAAIYLDQRFRTTNLRRPICVLLVDELDYIMTRQQNVIYNLFDWPGRKAARLVVIGISNTIDLPDMLLPKVHSRLGLTKIHFEPYTKAQIKLIVEDRLQESRAFSTDAIELCSAKISTTTGDIRRALTICRRAAEIAEEDDHRNKLKARKSSSATAASSAASSSSTASDASLMISPAHIHRAIADLQSSNFIQYLTYSSTPYEKLLLSGMITSIKYTNQLDSEDMNPPIPFDVLISHTERNMKNRGIESKLAQAQGIKIQHYAEMSKHDWLHIIQQWQEMKIVQVNNNRHSRWPDVQLNLLCEDIDYAFQKDELWNEIRQK